MTVNFHVCQLQDAVDQLLSASHPGQKQFLQVESFSNNVPQSDSQSFVQGVITAIKSNSAIAFCEQAVAANRCAFFAEAVKKKLFYSYLSQWKTLFLNRGTTSFLQNKSSSETLLATAMASLRFYLAGTRKNNESSLPRKISSHYFSLMSTSLFIPQDALSLSLFIERTFKRTSYTYFKKGTFNTPCTMHRHVNAVSFSLKGARRDLFLGGSYKVLNKALYMPLGEKKAPFFVAEAVNRIKKEKTKQLFTERSREMRYQACDHEVMIARLLRGEKGVLQLLSTNTYFKQNRAGQILLENNKPIQMQSQLWELFDGDLFSVIHENKYALTFNSKLKIAKDIMVGLLSMHEKRICHADLNVSNALFRKTTSGSFEGAICDFSLSFILGFDSVPPFFNNGFYGTCYATSPELFGSLEGKNEYLKQDEWALGILLYEFFFEKQVPWNVFLINCYKEKKPITSDLMAEFHNLIIEHVEKPLAACAFGPHLLLILQLLRLDPKNRISLKQLVQNPLFQV